VPLCEHLDKLGITIRSGDRRHVNPLESAIRADPRTRV
jgi:hypothetical protein